MDISFKDFVWNAEKELANIDKHGIDFSTAALVFRDSKRKVFTDSKHNSSEKRFFCIGKIDKKIVTVRYVFRQGKIRIFGAGFWRKGVRYYEKED